MQTPNGVRYTRSGRFHKADGGDGKYYLADSEGNFVLDRSGSRIVFSGGEDQKQNVGVFTFSNLGGLQKSGDSYYGPTGLSGQASAVQNADVRQGALEASCANMATELSNLIVQQRAFEMDAKMVQMTDEVMQTVNSLR